MGAAPINADRQTDMKKLIGVFCYYSNARNKWVMSTVKLAKWQSRGYWLYIVITCLVKRIGETRSTQINAWYNLLRQPALQYCRRSCLPCKARVRTFLDTNIQHITCLSVILQWVNLTNFTCKNSHKFCEMNVLVIPTVTKQCVCVCVFT